MNPEWLRYYLAAKLNSRVEDVDFNPTTSSRASTRTWSAGINIASRARPASCQALRRSSWRPSPGGEALLDQLQTAIGSIVELYAEREYGKAIREVMALADRVNEYVDANKPWELAKQEAWKHGCRMSAPPRRGLPRADRS